MEILTLGLEPQVFGWLIFGLIFGGSLLVGIVNLSHIRLTGMTPEAADQRAAYFAILFISAGAIVLLPGVLTLTLAFTGQSIASDQIVSACLAVGTGFLTYPAAIGFSILMVRTAERSGGPQELTAESVLDAVN